MITRCKTLLFFLALFLYFCYPNISMESPSMEPTGVINSIKWVDNLNFTYNGLDLNDGKNITRSSSTIIQWHAKQADELFKAYNYCQGKENGGHAMDRRNVLKSSFMIIYSIGEKYYLKNIIIDDIFINGTKDSFRYIELKNYDNLNVRKKFVFLDNYIYEEGGKIREKVFHKLLKMGLKIYGGQNAVQRTIVSSLNQPYFQSNWHSEQSLLIHLSQNIIDFRKNFIQDLISKGIKKEDSKKVIIHDFIINIASLKDMCPKCVNTFTEEMKNGEIFFNDLKSAMNEQFVVKDDCKLTVLASGISAYGETENSTRKGIKFHIFDRSKKLALPINENVVYHIDNPYTVIMLPSLETVWPYK